MFNVVRSAGDRSLATVHVLELADGSLVECAESVQPPIPRRDKWVLIVSTLKGCPVGCPICDAGGRYDGPLSSDEMLGQIDYLVRERFPDAQLPVARLKVQFARMGDPAFNEDVLDVLRRLPARFDGPCVMPSISTIAPASCDRFFDGLTEVKRMFYSEGRFQLQFSIHTTDEAARRTLVPVRGWSFAEMGAYARRFMSPGDRKITLNFAPAKGYPLEPQALLKHFPPEHFLVKLTPINPTAAAARSGLEGLIDPGNQTATEAVVESFRSAGYETILSIGELKENDIGSNCGMYVGRPRVATVPRGRAASQEPLRSP